MILKYCAKTFLFIAGWKIIGELPPKKCVVAMAPHTSNMDFILGWLGYTSVGVHSHYLIKKEVFKWYSGWLIKAMGGIPVDRSHSSNVVLQVADEFHKRNTFIVTITPEGTRKLVKNWKRGFYHIAMGAHVPVCMGFLDYKRKEGGFGPLLTPTGNFEDDFKLFETFYRTKTARFPEKFSLSGKETVTK